jgi:hypothetical protein
LGLSYSFNIPITKSLLDEDAEMVMLILDVGAKFLKELTERTRERIEVESGGLHDEREILKYLAGEGVR